MPNDQHTSQQIEDALVARNPRGMAQVQPVLNGGLLPKSCPDLTELH